MGLFALPGCDPTCTSLDIALATDPLTEAEEDAVAANDYFNTTGSCEKDTLACEEMLPATCEEACSEGETCTQVALNVEPCGRNSFFPDIDTGDHWLRKCLVVADSSENDSVDVGLAATGEFESGSAQLH